MAKDDGAIRKNQDDGNTKSNKKDASPNVSMLRRSGRGTSSMEQATPSPLSARKSGRVGKQTSPSPSSIKKKNNIIEKTMSPSPLRRSNRGKTVIEVPALLTVKPKKGKPANSLKENVVVPVDNDEKDNGRKDLDKSANGPKENVVVDNGRKDLDSGSRKRKRFNARIYKALFIPQRIRIKLDDDGSEGQDNLQPDTIGDKDLLVSLGMIDVDEEVKDRDVGVGKCNGEANDQSDAREPDCRQKLRFTEEHQVSPNNGEVQGSPDIAPKAFLGGKSMDLVQEDHIICSLQTIPLDGKSIESGNVEKQIGGNSSPSNRNIADGDNHIPHTSSLRINHDLENQQELDSCDKVTGMSKVASVMENAENKVANTNTQNGGSIFNSSKFVEFWVPVQLSNVQLEQYCATLLSNDMALRSSSRNDSLGALKDTFISSRKCCNHPYLVDPRLQNLLMKNHDPTMLLDVGIKASGKLHFLDLVLPEIKKRQLKVLILFQPTSGTLRGSASASIGDILVDFVHQRFGEDSYEHIDGFRNVHSKKKAAVNIFNTDKSRFIFLLESRACHPKLKLSSVDIIIVFDSDLNPANDLKALQKIHINSHSQQIKIFRLNSSSTVEEKILKLAEQSVAVDISSNLRSTYDALLTWGASELFNKLTGFHKSSVDNISSEESFLKDVVEEFINIISHISKSKNTSKSIITRVQNCGIYGMNIPLHSELKAHIPNGDQPHIFWKTLLEGKFPDWKFVSLSTPRERKRPRNFAEPLNVTNPIVCGVKDSIVCGVKARKRTLNNINNTMEQSVQLKAVNAGNSAIPVHNESQSSFGDHFWSTEVTQDMNVIDEMNHHNFLKLTVSELCNNLKFSEDVKDIVKRFLKFVLKNYRVSEGPPSTLQAFMISVCWIGSALANFKINKRKAVGLAKKFMNFSCVQEEVFSVYSKLEVAKQAFLQHKDNKDILAALKECTPSPQEPRMSQSVSVNLQDARPENCEPSNEKTFPNNECETQKEIDEFNRKWNQKMANLVNDYEVDKALIRSLHRSVTVRSEKLKNLEKDFAYKKELLERKREIHLKNLKSTLLAAKTHVAADNELHSHHETQMATTLSRNPIGAQSNGADVNIANVREGDGANDMESTGSHKQMGDATVSIEPIGKGPAQQQDDMEIDVAGNVDSVEAEENAKGGSSNPKDVGVPAGNRNERNGDCTSQSVGGHNDSCGSSTLPSTTSDHSMPTILELQSDSLQQVPHSGTQNQEKHADLNPMIEVANDNLQPLEAGQVGQIISQDPSLDSHDELSIPLYVEYSNGNALQPENDQEDKDPLKAELKQLRLEEDNIIKSHKENKQRLKSECAKEIAKAIAQIRLKYNAKDQEADAVFNCKKKEIEANLSRLELNEALAAAFRQKCKEPTRSGNSGMQQVSRAGLAQEMHRRSGPSVTRHSPGQSSGGHQNTQPPHQIADQPSASFQTPLTTSPNNNHTSISSTPPTRPPPAINTNIPSTTPATSRQPPAINPISPSSKPSKSPPGAQSIMSAANARINAETGAQASHIQPVGDSEVRARAPHIRPLASGELRTPAPHMRPSASSEIRAPAPHLRPLASSEIRAPAPHLRPLASSEIRAPAPHLRLLASSEIRAPAPHMRPFMSTTSVSPQKILPTNQVKSSPPLTLTSNPLSPVLLSSPPKPFPIPPPPLSTSSVQSLPPEPYPVTPPAPSLSLPQSPQHRPLPSLVSESPQPSPPPPSLSESPQLPPPPLSTSSVQSLPPEPNPVSPTAPSLSLPESPQHRPPPSLLSESPQPPPPPPSLSQSQPLPQQPSSLLDSPQPSAPPPSSQPSLSESPQLPSPLPPSSLAATSSQTPSPSVIPIPTNGGPNIPASPPNSDLLNQTDFVQESSALVSSGHDRVCLSDEDFVVVD